MKKKLVSRIWVSYMDLFDHIQQSRCNIYFKSEEEAEKCVTYLNSNIIDKRKKSYYHKREELGEYKTAEEYIAEQEEKNELTK